MALRVPLYGLRADFTGPTGGTAGESVTFTDLTNGADTWQWDFGDGSGSTAQNPSHTYGATGSYSVKLTASKDDILAGIVRKENFITIAPVGEDPDALAFLQATNLTGDATISNAIDTLVKDLKDGGIWAKCIAIYPFVGGTASTHKFNLVDPADTDAAFRLVFSGGWTHASTGALPNGSNAYADTKISYSNDLSQNSCHVSAYSRTNTTNVNVLIGVVNSPAGLNNGIMIFPSLPPAYVNIFSAGGSNNIAGTGSDTLGLRTLIRNNSTDINYFERSTKFTRALSSIPGVDKTLFISAMNATTSGISRYDSREIAFASFGAGLTDQEAADLDTIVQAYQTALSRNV